MLNKTSFDEASLRDRADQLKWYPFATVLSQMQTNLVWFLFTPKLIRSLVNPLVPDFLFLTWKVVSSFAMDLALVNGLRQIFILLTMTFLYDSFLYCPIYGTLGTKELKLSVIGFGCDIGGIFLRVYWKSTMLPPLLKCPWWHICNAFMYVDGTKIVSAPFWAELQSMHGLFARENTKISWCWQTRATRLEVSQGHQTWYHSIC